MNSEQPTAVTPAPFWALLIGIDRYQTQPALRGCVNDIQAMCSILERRYNVPASHLRMLTNEEATRAHILKTFQEFLIDNPDIQRGDQILFHYSGHGSQMPVEPGEVEPDGLNETLVPYDSRTPGVFDIPDKTLMALLDRLAAAKGDQITVILDSCHSGSGTRRPEDPSAPRVRRVPVDDRMPPADLDADIRARVSSRAAGPSGWATANLPYVLLAACRDREEAHEYEGKIEHATAWYGALTFFTVRLLQALPEDTTYSELHEQVAALVNGYHRNQMPQCEGDRERQLFGRLRVQRDPFIPVQRVEQDGRTVTLGAGLVHGLRPGTVLAVYPPEVRTQADLPPTPLAVVRVASVATTTAQAEAEDTPAQPIPQFARAIITQQVYTGLRQTVRLEPTDDAEHADALARLRQAIEHATADDQPSPYLRLVDDPHALVDLRVKAEAGQFWIYGDNELLVEPEPLRPPAQTTGRGDPAVKVRRALESIVRYRTLLSLHNEDLRSQLAGKVKLRLRRYVDESTGPRLEDLLQEAIGPGGELTLYFDPDHMESNRYVVDVLNESERDVYPHVFILSPDYSIGRLHPRRGIQEAVRPNKGRDPYPIGLQRGTQRLEFYLPSGWDASRDYLKAIVTTEETDLSMLEQKALEVPPPTVGRRRGAGAMLQELLDTVMLGEGTRHGRTQGAVITEDWTTLQLTINTVRKYQTTTLDTPPAHIPLSDELTLVKPAGFTGQVTVTTLGSATRGEESDPGLRPPPGLARFPHLFEPVGRSGTRSLGPTGLVVAFDVDEASRQLITPDNPLRLELSTTRSGEAVDLIPVVFDGEDYLLAGYGTEDGRAVAIVSLPPPIASPAADGRPTVRGLGHTLRLFIYKKLGRYTSDMGLHRATLQDGQVVYSEVQRHQFQAGQHVAVFVHGLMSDTRWMVTQLAPFLRQGVCLYDHLLTWDYETFGTRVEDNGAQFALALKQQCGFGSHDGISVDVYAHSMGTLVSRCMIELSGGHEFIDRLVLAGPPNRGSTLATTGRGFVFLATSLLNYATCGPILSATNWVLRQLYRQGVGVADLAVDSPILQKLNALEEPSNVPYLVLAGENLPAPGETRRLNRIAHKVLDTGLDTLFGEQNDIAIGLSSMRSLRGGAYPNLQVQNLPCDHFHYYVTPEGQRTIKEWVTGG